VSPVVHRGSVYVGGLDGVYALDARDGSPRWSRETSGSVNEAVLGRDDRVFASTGETLLALDTRGQEGWTYTTGDDRFSTAAPAAGWQRLRPLHDTGAWERRRHPARHCWGPADGVAVRTRRDRLRHPNRGRWRRIHPWRPAPRAVGRDRGGSLDGPVRSTAGVSTDGDRLYLPIDDGALVALDTADGTERWRVSLASEEGVFLRTRPLVTERSVIVTTEKPGLDEPANTFAVDRRNGEVRWQREQPGNIGYDAVAAGGRLYVPVLWDFTLDRERRGH